MLDFDDLDRRLRWHLGTNIGEHLTQREGVATLGDVGVVDPVEVGDELIDLGSRRTVLAVAELADDQGHPGCGSDHRPDPSEDRFGTHSLQHDDQQHDHGDDERGDC